MKRMRIFGMLMALLVSLAGGTSAFAADPPNITVTGSNTGYVSGVNQSYNYNGNANDNSNLNSNNAVVKSSSYPGYVGSQAVSGARSEALSGAEMDIFFEGVSAETVAYYSDHGGKLKDFEIKWTRPAETPTTFVKFSSTKPANAVSMGVFYKEIKADDSYDINMSISKKVMEHGGDIIQASLLRRVDTETSSRGVGTGGLLCLVGINAGVNSGSSKEEDGKIVVRLTIWKVTQPCPPVVKDQPPCNEDVILARIAKLQSEIDGCTDYCNYNLGRRDLMIKALIELYQCQKYDERILRDGVMIGGKLIKGVEFQFLLASRNYAKGEDISRHQQEADAAWKSAKFYYSGYLKIVRGKNFANDWGWDNGVEAVPSLNPNFK